MIENQAAKQEPDFVQLAQQSNYVGTAPRLAAYPDVDFIQKLYDSKHLVLEFLGNCFLQVDVFSLTAQQAEHQEATPQQVDAEQKKAVRFLVAIIDLLELLAEFWQIRLRKEEVSPRNVKDLDFRLQNIAQLEGPTPRPSYIGSDKITKATHNLQHILKSVLQKMLEIPAQFSQDLTVDKQASQYTSIVLCLTNQLRDMVGSSEFLTSNHFSIIIYICLSCSGIIEYDPYKVQQTGQAAKSKKVLPAGESSLTPRQSRYVPIETQPIHPPKHNVYIANVAEAYSEFCPVRLTKLVLDQNFQDPPEVEPSNYFSEECEHQILHYFRPGTKLFEYYNLVDMFDALSITKEFKNSKELKIGFLFSKDTRSVITPSGKIFITNSRAKPGEPDKTFYELNPTDDGLKIRAQLPVAKINHAMLHLNGFIYIVGGSSPDQKCTRSCHRYDIKKKAWSEIGKLNYAVRNTSITSFNSRYIFKVSGLNEFDYIDKNLQCYDSMNNGWSIVRTAHRAGGEQIEVLYNSFSVAINANTIFVFGGSNANTFQTDTGYAVEILEVRERKRKPSNIEVSLRSFKDTKRNILSFAGIFKPHSALQYKSSIYFLRQRYY